MKLKSLTINGISVDTTNSCIIDTGGESFYSFDIIFNTDSQIITELAILNTVVSIEYEIDNKDHTKNTSLCLLSGGPIKFKLSLPTSWKKKK